MTDSEAEKLNYIITMLTDLINLYRNKKISAKITVGYFDDIMSIALGRQNPELASRIIGDLMKKHNEKPNFFVAKEIKNES